MVCNLRLINLQMIIGKACVRKPVAKGKRHWHLFCIIVPVSHEDTFLVCHVFTFPKGKIRRIIRQFERNRLCQFPAGAGVPIQDVSNSFPHGLSAKVGFQNTLYPGKPRHFNRRTIVQDNNDLGLYGKNLINQTVLAFGQPHMGTVIPL